MTKITVKQISKTIPRAEYIKLEDTNVIALEKIDSAITKAIEANSIITQILEYNKRRI